MYWRSNSVFYDPAEMSHCYLPNILGINMPWLKWNNYQVCLAFLSQMLYQVFLFRCHLSLSSCCVFHGYSVNNSLRTYASRNPIVLHPLKLALVGFQFVQPPLLLLCNTDWNQNFFDVFFVDVRESRILKQKKQWSEIAQNWGVRLVVITLKRPFHEAI